MAPQVRGRPARIDPDSTRLIPQYFTRHDPHHETDDVDGHSLYRAIAAPLIGDSRDWRSIRDAVLYFTLTLHSNTSHPLHAQYKIQKARFYFRTKLELFAALECPDLAPDAEVLWIIAHALDVRLHVATHYYSNGRATCDPAGTGPKDAVPVFVLEEQDTSAHIAHFSSLLPDTSGKAILTCLEWWSDRLELDARQPPAQRKYNGLKLNQIRWTWEPASGAANEPLVKCYNGFRDEAELRHYPARDGTLMGMETFAIVVSEPQQVDGTLEMLEQVIKHLPSQYHEIKVSGECTRGRLLPYFAIDVEFLKLARHLVDGKTPSQIAQMIERGELEEICSVLTIAVGRHLSIMFNIAYMLEHANENTVPALERLFKSTVLNPKLLKVWWNPQCDFRVLDNTIAHMYQGTLRKPYFYAPNPARPEGHCIYPQFHIKNEHLNGTRPISMYFPNVQQDYDLHLPGPNQLGMTCPCHLGNIDIAALLNSFCRQHGLNMPKMVWAETRRRFKYGDLLELTLRGHRLLPLLRYMKSCHEKAGVSPIDFYQGMGQPGMEKDDMAMAYNGCDVFGLNLIMEQIVGAEDKQLVGRMLLDYSSGKAVSGPAERRVPQRPSELCFLSGGRVFGKGMPLFEDDPRAYMSRNGSS